MEISMKIVGDTYKGLRLCYFNARSSSKHKVDYLSYLLFVLKAEVICTTETWFRPHVDDGFCQIVGYNVVRHDRTLGVRGGGIALYIKGGLYYKVVAKSGDDSTVEYLRVVVGGDTPKCLVMCVYNPHRSNCVDEVFRVVGEFSIAYEYIILCGDCDLLLCDGRAKRLCDAMVTCGLAMVNSWPTRYAPNCLPSLLDIMYVSDDSLVLRYDQFPLVGVSDRELMLLVSNIRLGGDDRRWRSISYRDISAVNVEQPSVAASMVCWNDVSNFGGINDKFECLNGAI
uniref:Endonuclease/exonuclease/phosphatase domain-containing protein n=1 Tax=Glossina brevipalpis TaxID=37001 RepID=A0A1A9VZF9_9MUSC